MKKIILFAIMALMSLAISAQEFSAPNKRSSKIAFTDTITTFTYKMSDNTYKVYTSKSGAFYIWKTSKKTGKLYKMYLPKEVQKQMGRKYDEE